MSLNSELKTSINERGVADAYNRAFNSYVRRDVSIIHQHNVKVDGLLRLSDFLMSLEYKYDKDFSKRSNVIEVIVQVLYYLKDFEKRGDKLPNVCFVGEKKECFCFHVSDIAGYLSTKTQWDIAPSAAGKQNKKLFKLFYNDKNINPHVHIIDDKFQIKEVLKYAISVSQNSIWVEKITEKNINRLFTYFTKRILKGYKAKKQLTANDLVNVFMTSVLNKNENYIHPHKPSTLVTKSFGEISVNGYVFKSFFKYYQRDYSVKEKDILIAICDRLIQDVTRLRQGEFFTPTEWVDEAHRMIEAEFGVDWKEKYVVWDPACGTGNLTRDYQFKELYCSTLNQSDLDIMDQMGYNPEATKFQFDFLNDSDNIMSVNPDQPQLQLEIPNDFDDKFPQGLKDALQGSKPVIVFMNPPYATSSTTLKGVNCEGLAKTRVNKSMLKEGMGLASQQLYIQFLFRVIDWQKKFKSQISICLFSPNKYLSSRGYVNFRNYFLSSFKFKNGMFFNASHFSDVSSAWGILFSIWDLGDSTIQREFPVIVKDLDSNVQIIKTGNIKIYNVGELIPLSSLIRYKQNKREFPQFSSGLKIRDSKKSCGLDINSFSTLISQGNCPACHQSMHIVNGGSACRNKPVNRTTFYDCIAIFGARKPIKPMWLNDANEFFAPNIEHPDYEQWNKDSIVYSLFNGGSQQTSLRDITYKDKQWDIKNEWFWMSKDQIQVLAENHRVNEIELDVKHFGKEERFVYNKLQEITLSPDAQEVLDAASLLVEKSFEYRAMMIEEFPEYHLDTWDAGWYQIKKILKQYMPDELKVFSALYKEFESRIREGVYKFGFLPED